MILPAGSGRPSTRIALVRVHQLNEGIQHAGAKSNNPLIWNQNIAVVINNAKIESDYLPPVKDFSSKIVSAIT